MARRSSKQPLPKGKASKRKTGMAAKPTKIAKPAAAKATRPKATKATKPPETSSRGATSRGERSPLEHALDRFLAIYAKHMLVGDRARPDFTARLDGAHLLAEVRAPDGVQRVRRRASAHLGWCGDLWGAAQSAEERRRWPSLVATFTTHPSGTANGWGKFFDLEGERDWFEGLEAIAQALVDSGDQAARQEAILILRRLYEVDLRGHDRDLYVRFQPRIAPAAIAKEVKADASVPVREIKGSTTPHAEAKHYAPYATARASAVDLLAVAMHLDDTLPHLSLSNTLTFAAIVDPALSELLREGDGAAYELGIGLAQNLGMKLFNRRAYAEAKRYLDRVIAHHGSLPESLRARWECRLYLDACAGAADLDAAEEDWRRAAELDEPSDASSVGQCMFWAGDTHDRRRVALARVAKGLTKRAEGEDACEHRKIAKEDRPTPAERQRLLARAAELSGAAVKGGAKRVARDLQQASGGASVTTRGFQAEEYAARAGVLEASGDLQGALADFEAARQLRVAGGLAWQIDHFGPDIRRLRSKLAGAPARAPVSFEPEWLLAATRSSAEREAAVTAWAAQPWQTFPDEPAEARGRPFAYVVLRDVLAASAALWKLADADGMSLGDRLAFAERALALLDPWFDRRDASRLESVLDDSHEVAFFGEGTHLPSKSKQDRAPLLAWLAQLASAEPLDEATVLVGLEGEPWQRLRACFAKNVESYDPLRELHDVVRAASLSGDDVAVVLHAYQDLLHNDWSSFGSPRGAAAKWAQHGPALAKLDAEKLAPALIAWTRSRALANAVALAAKWLWPFRYVWSDAVPALLSAVEKGALDGPRKPSKTGKSARRECLEWIAARET